MIKKPKHIDLKKLITGAIVAGVIIIAVALYALNTIQKSVVNTNEGETAELYVPTGATLDDVITLMNAKNMLKDEQNLRFTAGYMKCEPKAGRYILKDEMSSKELLSMLRSGTQKAINFTFNNCRTTAKLAGIAGRTFEADSAEFLKAMRDAEFLKKYDIDTCTELAIFLPNTYNMYWNTTPHAFIERMHTEYKKFWNKERTEKAGKLKLTPIEVTTIASIVEEETNITDEWPTIAGIYLNRLRIRMPLQACPTLKYCIGNFGIRRVLEEYKNVESAYNTYKHAGIPPGPIRMTNIKAIDAVLNAKEHKYLYMCAQPNYSGRHNFSETLSKHNNYASEYQRWLNKQRIFK